MRRHISSKLLHAGILLLGILLTFVLLLALTPGALAYDHESAVDYARKNYDKRNPAFFDRSQTGGDCSNFVSQCLKEGGFDLTAGTGYIPPVGHNGLEGGVDTKGCIPNCDDLDAHLRYVQHADITTGTSAADALSNLGPGDVVIFGTNTDPWTHAAIVVDGSGSDVKLASHDPDVCDKKISWFFEEYSHLKQVTFYHFPTAAETGHAQEYFGTGDYYGDGALKVVIYEPGLNYEGYILANTDPTEQDMVIGEDTSSYAGCSYYVEGYCSDADKGIPSVGGGFEQPWTCDSPDHWAYWVKKAIKFANQNDYGEEDTLDAVWHITDRSGYSGNEILSSIGYPEDGPDKNVSISYRIKGHVLDVNGAAMSGVSVTLSRDISWTRATDVTGYFEFLYLPEGNYAITIDNANLTANPPIREYTPLNANQEDQDFTVSAVSGPDGVPWVWVIVGIVIVFLVIAILWRILAGRSQAT